jgi:hypothetical protein
MQRVSGDKYVEYDHVMYLDLYDKKKQTYRHILFNRPKIHSHGMLVRCSSRITFIRCLYDCFVINLDIKYGFRLNHSNHTFVSKHLRLDSNKSLFNSYYSSPSPNCTDPLSDIIYLNTLRSLFMLIQHIDILLLASTSCQHTHTWRAKSTISALLLSSFGKFIFNIDYNMDIQFQIIIIYRSVINYI